jgi:hypothetical protein
VRRLAAILSRELDGRISNPGNERSRGWIIRGRGQNRARILFADNRPRPSGSAAERHRNDDNRDEK